MLKCKVVFTEAYLEPIKTSMRKHFCKHSSQLQAINYFCKKSSIADVRLGSKYESVSITLNLTFLEEHSL